MDNSSVGFSSAPFTLDRAIFDRLDLQREMVDVNKVPSGTVVYFCTDFHSVVKGMVQIKGSVRTVLFHGFDHMDDVDHFHKEHIYHNLESVEFYASEISALLNQYKTIEKSLKRATLSAEQFCLAKSILDHRLMTIKLESDYINMDIKKAEQSPM